jgi:hypothetical protein
MPDASPYPYMKWTPGTGLSGSKDKPELDSQILSVSRYTRRNIIQLDEDFHFEHLPETA